MKIPWINALFACAMVDNCSLAEAQRTINAPQEDLQEAHKYMLSVIMQGNDPTKWISDYQQGVTECFKKLENAN